MKNLLSISLIVLLICSCTMKMNATPLVKQYPQSNNIEYTFGAYKLNKERYIYNIRINVDGYVNRQGWNYACRQEFINAYKLYLEALNDPTDPYRLSTNEFGTIFDAKGLLGDEDKDDFWYDKNGNRITRSEYENLKENKKKKYTSFSANRQVATYFYKVAKGLVEKMDSEKKDW